MVFLAGAAQHVLGQLGSLQQTAAGVQSNPAAGANALFNLNSSTQGTATASSGTSGTGTWWSSPSTMNALLSAQDSSTTDSSSGSTAPAQGHHGGHHHHSQAGSVQGDAGNTSGAGTSTDGTSASFATPSGANGGPASFFSQLINTQMFSALPAGQSLSTLV